MKHFLKLILFYLSIILFLNDAFAQQATDFLAKANASLSARVNKYNYSHFNRLENTASTSIANESKTCNIDLLGSKWEVNIYSKSVPDRPDARDFKVFFKLVSGNLDQANVSVDINFGKWKTDNFVLLPASAYNGNRFDWRRIAYSPKLLDPRDIGPDKPTIVTDIPKLDLGSGPSRIQERSGGMATPSIGFQSPGTGLGTWLLTTQGNNFGDYGMDIEESRDRSTATISLHSPLVRELYKYKLTDNRWPSDDIPANFKQGDTISFNFRLYAFPANNIQALYDRFFAIRKDLTGKNTFSNQLGFSSAFETEEKKFNEINFVPDFGYYAVGLRNMFLMDWQIGWTGGMISTYPLLFAGSDATRNNVIRNFDWLFPNGLAPSGFFWDSGEKGTKWYGGDIRKPHTKNWHLVRKSGDGLFYIVKQFMLMDKMKMPIKPAWKNGTKGVANAFVKLWRKWHQFGNFVDSETGDVIVGGSTSGAIVPGALALSFIYYADSAYLNVARESAQAFYVQFGQKGFTTGGPGDAMQNPDSESCYALIESYVILYEVTGEKKYLLMAEEISRQFATWVSSYNYKFPPNSLFGRTGIHSAGAVGANTQNKHGAPGICTHSGSGLFKIYRSTGNTAYMDLLQDIAHNIIQYMGHPLKPIEKVKDGWMCERVSTTDWLEGIGEISYQTTWAETALMLTTIEIPGLYVEPDKARHFMFDHAEAKIVANTKSEYKLAIKNPTPAAITIRVLAENAQQRLKPIGQNYLYGGKTITLKPGEEQVLSWKK